ncbi:two-component sensor histidine kinase [Gordonibacter sp. An230]|uniref:sensor histidine kinase n=1 Tax=Gordonibacter sp. An230 TaxID=1965592 RepID=UPI000B3B00E1|nr:histidine kinase [Gordonibacter sp. An230]OUO91243.1 two-component sensor histidine kinase [Gordonibacter sp. An230]
MNDFLMSDRPMTAKDWAIDAVVTAAAFLFGCVQLMLTASSIVVPDLALRQYLGLVNVVPDTSAYVALALTTVPLVARRRCPWPVFLFCFVAFLGLQGAFGGLSLTIVGPAVALYTIANERGRSEAVVGAVVAAAGLLFVDAPSRTASLAFFTRFQNIAFVAAAAFAGYAYRVHRAYVRATEERALEAERTREEEAARRVEEERVRIAREVHDITAHSLSAVSIQAAAAERLIDRDPVAAREAVVAVRATAKSALDDIRSMIGVLRRGDEAETSPAAGTDRLDDLVSYLRGAGVAASLDTRAYDGSRVPAHVDMALFGIAREAATNIVRHAGARTATLRLALEDGQARLVVEDDGRAAVAQAFEPADAAPGRAGGGHGIPGMAERVHLLGGAFSAGPKAGGGFRVVASIPVRGTEG